MQKERGQEGNREYHRRIFRRTRQKLRQMRRDDSQLINQSVKTSLIQRSFEKKYQQVQRNQEARYPRRAIPRLVITNRKHGESVKLGIESLSDRAIRRLGN